MNFPFFTSVNIAGNSPRAYFACLPLALLLAFAPMGAKAQGDLLVTPRRILFENATRVQELTLANIGKDTARFLVSIMEIRMKEDGSFEQITVPDSGQQFASKNLRIYPRNVVVAPGASQLVKVQLIKADMLNPGEYRSHIYIRAVPRERPLGDKDVIRDSSDISVKLTAVFGLSVPAIVRVGENSTKIILSDPSFSMVDKKPRLYVTLNREGIMSTYGDITVERTSPDGVVTEVGVVKGIAVYTPNTKRRFKLDLDTTHNTDYRTGTLRIVYKTQKDARYQDSSVAELSLQ